MKKYAVLSMDVEDWYHTGYLNESECEKGPSMLDGLDLFIGQLNKHRIPVQLFVLADLLELYPDRFRALARAGHEIASHGKSHVPPTLRSESEFRQEIDECVRVHRSVLGRAPEGFRACRFMIDRSRLEILRDTGFLYDSSVIDRGFHRQFDFTDFNAVSPHILESREFFEFRPAELSLGGWRLPISGGGAMRLLPWWMSSLALRLRISDLDLYSFYTHPIDISHAEKPRLPMKTGLLSRFRMDHGRFSMLRKLEKLILMLKLRGFEFTTFGKLRSAITSHQSPQLRSGS